MLTLDITTATPVEIDQALAEIEKRRYAALDKAHEAKRRLRSANALRNPVATDVAYYQGQIEKFEAEAERISAEREPYEAEFSRRGGWTRYFHVKHLHTSARCSSFRLTTRIGWLPKYSGRSEAEMIEAAGDLVCTKCVPEAPVKTKRPTIPELAEQWDKTNTPDVCPGSGTGNWKDGKVRTGFYTGNGGTCAHCDKWVSNTSRNSRTMRKHKP